MAVNKNFVVKNGLEVDTNTLFVDSANNRVAIGTTVPTATLDVRGKILSNSQVESFVGKFVGIVTAGAVGVVTMTTTDAVVSGFSTLGKANATSLNVTTGFSTVQALSSKDLTVSIGATISKDLNVGAAATVGAALTVTGNAYLNGDVDIPVTVRADPTVTSFSNLTNSANFDCPVTVNAAPTVAAAPMFTSLLNVEPLETIMSVADADRNVENPEVTFNSSAFALPSFVDEPVPTL